MVGTVPECNIKHFYVWVDIGSWYTYTGQEVVLNSVCTELESIYGESSPFEQGIYSPDYFRKSQTLSGHYVMLLHTSIHLFVSLVSHCYKPVAGVQAVQILLPQVFPQHFAPGIIIILHTLPQVNVALVSVEATATILF